MREPSDAVRSWSSLADRYAESEYARDALLKIAETWEREERWIAAAEAARSAGVTEFRERYYRAIPEWVAGYGVMTAGL